MGGQHDMTKDKQIEENFSDILSMLKKKVQEKDEEIMRLREENTKLKEKLTEIDPDFVLEETFTKIKEGNVQGEWVFCKGWNRK